MIQFQSIYGIVFRFLRDSIRITAIIYIPVLLLSLAAGGMGSAFYFSLLRDLFLFIAIGVFAVKVFAWLALPEKASRKL